MSGAAFAVQRAVHDRLVATPAVVSVLGGARVWDHVPREAAFPYVSFGVTTERDWSTGTEAGGEHIFTIHVWSRAAGRHEADAIIAAIRAALHDQPLTLTGHRLVNLRLEIADVRREVESEIYRGILRLRAVTEPII